MPSFSQRSIRAIANWSHKNKFSSYPKKKKKKKVETIDFLCEHSLSMIMLGSKDLGLNV